MTRTVISCSRRWDVAILGARAAMNEQHHALTVDVGDFQIQCLLESEPAGVDSGEEDEVVEGGDVSEDLEDSRSDFGAHRLTFLR